ncbi:MAG: FAD-dependent oxidoreductase [Anaerolineae bacterium]
MNSIVIIGAGIGGLSTAVRLAAAGRKVLVLEQNNAVGGKMAQLQRDGYRWDTGPSVITMRPVLEELPPPVAAWKIISPYNRLSR